MNIEAFYREESGRILATLIRLVGDFDLAEEVIQDAFVVALEQWSLQGIPTNPRAWLISTARHKAIDRLRRRSRFREKSEEVSQLMTLEEHLAEPETSDGAIADDRLRLIFTCCHPALAVEAQVALTLRTLCGLSTEEIARAFLTPIPTMAQRLVRAKQKIREAKIPYQVPSPEVLPERLDGVLRAVYLMFNEGYTATVGDVLIRQELCREAICLGRVLCELLPTYPETHGLLALLLLHDSRRDARINATGEIILLEEQERWRWDWSEIREGIALVEKALHLGNGGFYTVQAAIAAVHAQAERAEDTDWRQIAELYDILLRRHPSAIIELNRAVAVAMAHGLEHGLEIIAGIEARGDLHNYHLLPAARADLLRRLGRRTEAANAYQQALSLVTNETERRFLERRLEEMRAKAS